jgi:hypothetical protein
VEKLNVIRRYRDKYPNWSVPNCHTIVFFLTTHFQVTGVFHGMQWDVGHPYSKHMEKKSLHIAERQPTKSNKRLAANMGTSQVSVHHTQQEQFYTFHIHSVQELLPHDASAKHAFCLWILQQLDEDPMFTAKV